MMNHEPKCVTWKRLGAKKVMSQISGFTQVQELDFWRKQTDKLKKSQQKTKQFQKHDNR